MIRFSTVEVGFFTFSGWFFAFGFLLFSFFYYYL